MKKISALFLMILFLSCNSFRLLDYNEWSEKNSNTDEVDIYVAGWYRASGGFYYACYWINDQLNEMEYNRLANTNSKPRIFIENNDVYISGDAYDGSSILMPAYWKNNRIKLLNTTTHYTTGIYIKSGIVYTTGYLFSPDIATFWTNNTQINIFPGRTYSVFIDDDLNLYLSGVNNDATPKAFYFKNGEIKFLDDNYSIKSIFVLNGNIYMAGDDTGNAKYWFNGIEKLYAPNNIFNSITLNENDIYIAGSYWMTPYANYWKNGAEIQLSNGTTAESIFVYKNNAYIAGSTSTTACYWINNYQNQKILPVPSGSTLSKATSIFIKKKSK